MNRDDIIRMAQEAGLYTKCDVYSAVPFDQLLERFAALVYAEGHKDGLDDFEAGVLPAAIAAERERVAEWMMARSYATGHGETLEELLEELGWQIEEKIAREREACAKVCDELVTHTRALGDNDSMLAAISCAIAIRARGDALAKLNQAAEDNGEPL